jgi:nucleotide-binding universal stress UspA family protein
MYKRILAPIDGSASSLRGLAEAARLAKESGATLRLMHAVNEYFIDTGFGPALITPELIASVRRDGAVILAAAESKASKYGVKPETVLLDRAGTSVADLIRKEAEEWQADLIVMGTRGRRGLSRLAMGSDAETVVRSSSIPVLLVRTPDDYRKAA